MCRFHLSCLCDVMSVDVSYLSCLCDVMSVRSGSEFGVKKQAPCLGEKNKSSETKKFWKTKSEICKKRSKWLGNKWKCPKFSCRSSRTSWISQNRFSKGSCNHSPVRVFFKWSTLSIMDCWRTAVQLPSQQHRLSKYSWGYCLWISGRDQQMGATGTFGCYWNQDSRQYWLRNETYFF